ncbi:MAG TPA: hypothetical protein VG146_14655 [Verrucomicrobiae bacterium]|nr:hypothetical protein [Verrucomicrobiae bacterium]
MTLEEQLRGWLAEIHRLTDPHRQIVASGDRNASLAGSSVAS